MLVAYNNVFYYLPNIQVCAVYLFVLLAQGVAHFKMIVRKSVFSLLSCISIGDNQLVRSIGKPKQFLLPSSLYKLWQTLLYVV